MSYEPDVHPGDPPSIRDLDALTIHKLSVSSMSNNVYLLTSRASGAQLLIDAAAEPGLLVDLVRTGGTGLTALVTTHRHWDHHRALADVCAAFSPMTYAGAPDASALPVAPDVRLEQGDAVTFGDISLDVIRLTGHTPGSVALAYSDPRGHVHLFTGDCLFPGGPGRTTRLEDFTSLMDDLEERVFGVYADDTDVYPGHGTDTTVGAERPHLNEWRARGW